MGNFSRLISANSCELIADTAARTGKKYFGFIAQEDTVVSVLNGGPTGVTQATNRNYLSEIGLSVKTLKQGALIVISEGEAITNLTLTSGSVIAYKG